MLIDNCMNIHLIGQLTNTTIECKSIDNSPNNKNAEIRETRETRETNIEFGIPIDSKKELADQEELANETNETKTRNKSLEK